MQQESPQQPLYCNRQHDQQQQEGLPGWLQQLSSSSRQDRLAVLSKLTITLQGQVADWKGKSAHAKKHLHGRRFRLELAQLSALPLLCPSLLILVIC
jgi:hypothetical protein